MRMYRAGRLSREHDDVARRAARQLGRRVDSHAGDPETRHLIDRRSLARMKRVGVSRQHGARSIVDEDALVWALNERLIAGAALDVYEKEPGSIRGC